MEMPSGDPDDGRDEAITGDEVAVDTIPLR
jgi:hypothetical protein